jgi:hypothetical protein
MDCSCPTRNLRSKLAQPARAISFSGYDRTRPERDVRKIKNGK